MSLDACAASESGSGGSPVPLRVRLHVPSCCVMQNEAKQHENIVPVFY